MSQLNTQMINFPAEGVPNGGVPGYMAYPADAEAVPGVVLIQEWWGLNDHIKDVAERLAGEGFAVIAPDLYHGAVTEEPDEARKLAMELDRDRAVREIQGAVDHLRGLSFVQPGQIGVMGFCMGGGLSAWMATEGQNVGAVAVFYGARNPIDDETAEQVSAAFLGIYGEADASIPLETIRANEAMLKKHNKTVSIHIYPDAPHAFFNDTRASYRPEAAADAWAKTLAWFRQYLA